MLPTGGPSATEKQHFQDFGARNHGMGLSRLTKIARRAKVGGRPILDRRHQ
jgi:hypothetical protein